MHERERAIRFYELRWWFLVRSIKYKTYWEIRDFQMKTHFSLLFTRPRPTYGTFIGSTSFFSCGIEIPICKQTYVCTYNVHSRLEIQVCFSKQSVLDLLNKVLFKRGMKPLRQLSVHPCSEAIKARTSQFAVHMCYYCTQIYMFQNLTTPLC